MKKELKTLRRTTRQWYKKVTETWDLEDHHKRLLILACQAWDRAQEAKEMISNEGSVILDRFQQKKPHLAVDIERNSMICFARLLRELALDINTSEEYSRPPRQY